ncbi:MAG: hypothetical protein IJB79_06245 [Candidatus Gastranaerophilales bacterium]|nr:hypothetical protein [Candidatus Gastranaerophilales bacterium]
MDGGDFSFVLGYVTLKLSTVTLNLFQGLTNVDFYFLELRSSSFFFSFFKRPSKKRKMKQKKENRAWLIRRFLLF